MRDASEWLDLSFLTEQQMRGMMETRPLWKYGAIIEGLVILLFVGLEVGGVCHVFTSFLPNLGLGPWLFCWAVIIAYPGYLACCVVVLMAFGMTDWFRSVFATPR